MTYSKNSKYDKISLCIADYLQNDRESVVSKKNKESIWKRMCACFHVKK